MAAFQLMGRVGLDASGFYRGLTKMKSATAPLGKHIGTQLRSTLVGYLGGAAVVGALRGTLEKAFDIKRDAAKLDVPADAFQTLTQLSDETGASVDELAKRYRDAGDDAKGFRSNVDTLTESLKEQGRILSSAEIEQFAGQKREIDVVKQKAGGFISKLYSWFSSGMSFIKNVRFADPEEIQKRVNRIADPGNPTSAAETAAREEARRIARSALAESAGKEKAEPVERLNDRLDVSADTMIGRHFGPSLGATGQNSANIARMQADIAAIRSAVSTFR